MVSGPTTSDPVKQGVGPDSGPHLRVTEAPVVQTAGAFAYQESFQPGRLTLDVPGPQPAGHPPVL